MASTNVENTTNKKSERLNQLKSFSAEMYQTRGTPHYGNRKKMRANTYYAEFETVAGI